MPSKQRKSATAKKRATAEGNPGRQSSCLKRAQRRFADCQAVLAGHRPARRVNGKAALAIPKDSAIVWMANSLFPDDGIELDTLLHSIETWYGRIVKSTSDDQLQSLFDEIELSLKRTIGSFADREQQTLVAGVFQALLASQMIPFLEIESLADRRESLIESLWMIAAEAESQSSLENLPLKSLGIELGISISFNARTPDELDARHLVDEFESIVESNLDGDGFPTGRWLSGFAAIVASWTRSVHLLRAMTVELDENLAVQLEWLVRQCLRMRGNDQRLAGSPPPMTKRTGKAFWQSVLAMSNDRDDGRLFDVVAGQKQTGKRKKLSALQAGLIAEPLNVSEWGGAAMLRSTWSPKSPRVLINFSGSETARCDLEIGRSHLLIQGDCLPAWTLDGQSIDYLEPLELVCQNCDDDLDYLELQSSTSSGDVFGRQILLSRTDEFLLIADSLQLAQSREIGYQCKWPLADSVSVMPETETRELYLQYEKRTSRAGSTESNGQAGAEIVSRRIQALVLPLSLPEWKTEPFPGKLEFNDHALQLTQSTLGSSLYIPVVIDLNPGRSKRKRTWRRLTVAENRQPVAPDVATAYRFQLDRWQWFFYRSLGPAGNRTFLGENTIAEFVFNRFDKKGRVHQLLQIET